MTALRFELNKLREADSLETLATPEAALDALKDDVQQLKSTIHSYSTLNGHAKPLYTKMVATTNSTDTRPRKSKRTKQLATGARCVVKDTIVNFVKIGTNELQVKRKQKFKGEGRINWWFVVHAKEETLKALDAAWPQSVQSTQKHWKLEKCLMYVDQTPSERPAAISE